MIRTVVGRPTTIIIIVVLFVGFGLYTAANLAIDLIPEVSFPVMMVYTGYTGAGPEQVEKTITRPLESQLSNVGGLNEISSTSQEGASQVILQFAYGTNMSDATNDVRDRLEYVKQMLPDEATSPRIFKFDPSMIPILRLKISGARSAEELRELALDIIQPRLEQVDGVALASVSGGRAHVVRVDIPQSRLEAYNLGFAQIKNALLANNLQISAGSITEGGIDYLLRSAGEFGSIEDIRNTIVATKMAPAAAGTPARAVSVRLRDIANVSDGYRDMETSVLINGEPGIFISIQKQSGKNSVQVADKVMERLAGIRQSLPAGVQIGIASDSTIIIRRSLGEVSSSAIMGLVLAVLILFVFLRSIKPTLVISFSIPISLVITLMLMYFFNLTLNLMTLAGLALGVGMLVDNSIVVLENIFRYREKGAKLHTAAILGTREMIVAIAGSTLTTICVFLPLAIFRSQLEFMGEMFSGLAFTIVISLLISLAVAVFLVPVLTSKYMPLATRLETVLPPWLDRIDRKMEAFYRGMENQYKRGLSWVLSHKKLSAGIVIMLFVVSLAYIPFAGFELMPAQEEDFVTVTATLPTGTAIEVTQAVLGDMEEIVKSEVSSYQDILVTVGASAGFSPFGGLVGSSGSIRINLPPFAERKESSNIVKEKLRRYFGDFPGVTFNFGGGSMQYAGLNASPVVITLKSDDLELAKTSGNQILAILKEKIPEATEPIFNLQEGLPEIRLIIDREKAYAMGLSMALIGQELKANIDGVTAGRYRSGGSEYDIFLILEKRNRDQLLDLDKVFIMNPLGQKIPLSAIAGYNRDTGPVSINRINQTRYLRITTGLAPGADVGTVVPRIQQAIAEGIPPNDKLVVEYGGDFDDLLRYGSTFAIIMIISIFLVYGVMASLFESFLDPFIVMFTVPLSVIGVVGMHAAFGEPLSLFTAVGMVMLLGIVVNNGIVLVDYTNLLRKRGISLRKACVEAGGNRLRPVLMTTLTTILGLLPVAFVKSEGSSLIQPLGKTVLGGLLISTLMTLFLIPALYEIFNKWSDRQKEKKLARHMERMKIRARKLKEAGR